MTYVISTRNRYEAQDKIKKKVMKVKEFLDANKMLINLTKTEIVEVMVRQKQTRLEGSKPQLLVTKRDRTIKVITAKEQCRLLGMNISQNANWKDHLEGGEKLLLPALRYLIGTLSHLSPNIPPKSCLLLANGLIISRIIYCIQIWGGLPADQARSVQTLMNKCACVVTGKSRRTSTRILMEECRWLYFDEVAQYHSLLMLWKVLWLSVPYFLAKRLKLDDNYKVKGEEGRIVTTKRAFRE